MTVAAALLLRFPVVALKEPVDPEVMVKEAGTTRDDRLLLTVMVMPPIGTLSDRFTVQVLVALEPRVEGLHATDVIVALIVKLMLARADEPL